MTNASWGLGTLLVAASLMGCSGGDDGGGGSTGGSQPKDGQATDVWSDYCVAVFSEDTAIEDGFGDELFTAKAGSMYLISRLDSPFGDGSELLYITSTGTESFDVDPASFTTDCVEGALETEYVSFADTVVYGDEALTNEICAIAQGDSAAHTGAAGFELVGDFNFSGPQTYKVQLSGFSAACDGASEGYISVPETQVFGTTTWLLPFETVSKPAP